MVEVTYYGIILWFLLIGCGVLILLLFVDMNDDCLGYTSGTPPTTCKQKDNKAPCRNSFDAKADDYCCEWSNEAKGGVAQCTDRPPKKKYEYLYAALGCVLLLLFMLIIWWISGASPGIINDNLTESLLEQSTKARPKTKTVPPGVSSSNSYVPPVPPITPPIDFKTANVTGRWKKSIFEGLNVKKPTSPHHVTKLGFGLENISHI